MIHYVCKYTPTELFQGFGEKCAVLEEMPENFEMSDQIAHAKSVRLRKIRDSGGAGRKSRGNWCLSTAVILCGACMIL